MFGLAMLTRKLTPEKALDTYREVIRIVKIHFGQLHAIVAEAMKRMGSIHVEKGDFDDTTINHLWIVERCERWWWLWLTPVPDGKVPGYQSLLRC